MLKIRGSERMRTAKASDEREREEGELEEAVGIRKMDRTKRIGG